MGIEGPILNCGSCLGKCQAVCESTGNLWIKTYEAFEDRDIPIELANPTSKTLYKDRNEKLSEKA